MLDQRINKLVRCQYTQEPVGWSDLLPKEVHRQPTDDYLIERTMYRPRDLIVFFNCCIEQAVDRPEITSKMITQAEGVYSQERLRSLRDEWDMDYPELLDCVEPLKKKPPRFRLNAITPEAISEFCLGLAARSEGRSGVISGWASSLADLKMTPAEVRIKLMCVFYRVGLVGLKLESFTSDSWSFLHTPSVSEDQIRDDTSVVICPVFYGVLGINPSGQGV